MTDTRSIAFDATFMIIYIGFAAAMAVLSLVLLTLFAFDIEFGSSQSGAAVLNLAGWAVLPFAPRLYRRLIGHHFSWRANSALGAHVDF
jgi:hypothetical protein